MVWPTEAGRRRGWARSPTRCSPILRRTFRACSRSSAPYCYPNPAKGADLTIRAWLDEPADLEVEILDVAGERVARLTADGVPTVNEIVWDLSGVPSGLYIVRLEAGVSVEDADALGGSGRRTESGS